MEFSRHTDAKAERLAQIAVALRGLYSSANDALPPAIAEKLVRLEKAELLAKSRGGDTV